MYVNNLSITLNKDSRVLMEGLSFSLTTGDKAVVIGEEGNGKSTLLKAICAPEKLKNYAEISGKVVANEKIGYLAQEFSFSGAVNEFFAEIPDFYELSPRELNMVSSELGLPSDIYYSDQSVSTLSGGEKVKIQLAKLILEKSDLFLLDEPSNDIDISTLMWLEDFINTTDKPILYVSHDETLIENTANMVIHIEQLRRKTTPRAVVAEMSYSDYVENRQASFSKQTQVAQKEHDNYDKKVRRWREIYEKVENDLRTVGHDKPTAGRLLKKKMKSVKAQEKRYDKEKLSLAEYPDFEDAVTTELCGAPVPSGKTVLDFSLAELNVGERVLSRNVSLKIVGSKRVCIVGDNGIGKTTLLKKIYEAMSDSDLKIAYMPQNYYDTLEESVTPIEFLFDGTKEGLTKARTYLGCMKYRADEMENSISALSGGQKAKLLYLKMVLSDCSVLILDEPTRNFSPLTNPVIRNVLSSFGGAIISVSHDRKFIDEVCTDVYRLTDNGLIMI